MDDTTDSESSRVSRLKPNILITGTPGVGKTSTARVIADRLNMRHMNVGEIIKENKCYDGRDEELDTYILDEDKLLDLMECMLEEAEEESIGVIVDYHVCEIFPERWFDLVLVLRSTTEILFDRLTARGYNERKRSQNMESEIMQVILEEARESYASEIVQELYSNSLEDLEENVRRVTEWTKQWTADRNDR